MKKFVFKFLCAIRLPLLFREVFQRRKVTILLFHDIDKETADKTFAYLSNNYNIIDLDMFVSACESGDNSTIPNKALIITFDDGHISNFDLLPEMRKYNIPVTLFVCAGIINTRRHFWFKFNQKSVTNQVLKSLTNIDRRSVLANFGFDQDKEYETPQALNITQLNKMAQYINIQSHTMYHPILPKCTKEEAWIEIFTSKQVLEEEFGLEINSISYPNGDYSERDIELSRQAGYKCGITVDYGFNTIHSDLFRLKRLPVNDTGDINELIVKTSGVWGLFKLKNSRTRIYELPELQEEPS